MALGFQAPHDQMSQTAEQGALRGGKRVKPRPRTESECSYPFETLILVVVGLQFFRMASVRGITWPASRCLCTETACMTETGKASADRILASPQSMRHLARERTASKIWLLSGSDCDGQLLAETRHNNPSNQNPRNPPTSHPTPQ